MLKSFFCTILTFIMLLCATTFSVIIIGREVLSEENIIAVIDTITNDVANESSIIDTILEQDRNSNLNKYFDNEELTDAYGRLYRDFIFYESGFPDAEKPSINEIKELVNRYCDEYEKDTGNKVDMIAINGYFETFQLKIDDLSQSDNELSKFFELLYSDSFLNLVISMFAICLLFIFLIKREFLKTLKSISSVTIINGIAIISLGYVLCSILSSMNVNDLPLNNIAKSICNIFYRIGGISFCIGLTFLVIITIVKKRFINQTPGIYSTVVSGNNNESPLFDYQPINDVHSDSYLNEKIKR